MFSPLNKASFWYLGLAEFSKRFSGFHCFIDLFKDIRDSAYLRQLLTQMRGTREDAISPKTALDKKDLEEKCSVTNVDL